MSSARALRLPGSVAEVKASPPGPKIGAFFDLDGTLVAGFTGVILTQEQFRRREMGIGDLVGMIQAGLNHQLGRLEFEDLITSASKVMRGRSITDMDEVGSACSVPRSNPGSTRRCGNSCARTSTAGTPSA